MRTSYLNYLERVRRIAVGEPRTLSASALALLIVLSLGTGAFAEMPIVTDSRIKTFVYNENEVFNITTHYGFQSNIEFGERETIDTVSVGDRVAWQIIPAGRRLFIRAMEENAHTNMTIVTNRRAYQFDLRSSGSDAVYGSEELTYVMRFYYPGESTSRAPAGFQPASFTTSSAPMMGAPVMSAPVMPVASAPMAAPPPPRPVSIPAATPAPIAAPAAPVNYKYTYSGPNEIAPVKIYDDGRSTYFKFRGNPSPRFAVISARGEELAVNARPVGPGLFAVDAVAPRFSLRSSGQQVVVYNESNGGAS